MGYTTPRYILREWERGPLSLGEREGGAAERMKTVARRRRRETREGGRGVVRLAHDFVPGRCDCLFGRRSGTTRMGTDIPGARSSEWGKP